LEPLSSLVYAAAQAPVAATIPHDTTFLLPVPAIFIAANFAFAGIVHYNDVIEDYSHNIKSYLVVITIIAVLCSIFASSLFSQEGGGVSSFLLKLSLWCLIVIYGGLLAVCGYTHTRSYKRDKEGKRMVAASLLKQLRNTITKSKLDDWKGFVSYILAFFESGTTEVAKDMILTNISTESIVK
jgi:hypothetical protein